MDVNGGCFWQLLSENKLFKAETKNQGGKNYHHATSSDNKGGFLAKISRNKRETVNEAQFSRW